VQIDSPLPDQVGLIPAEAASARPVEPDHHASRHVPLPEYRRHAQATTTK
jgi:hypothetical protein